MCKTDDNLSSVNNIIDNMVSTMPENALFEKGRMQKLLNEMKSLFAMVIYAFCAIEQKPK